MGREPERHPCPGLWGGIVLRRTNRRGHTSSGAGVGCCAQAVVPGGGAHGPWGRAHGADAGRTARELGRDRVAATDRRRWRRRACSSGRSSPDCVAGQLAIREGPLPRLLERGERPAAQADVAALAVGHDPLHPALAVAGRDDQGHHRALDYCEVAAAVDTIEASTAGLSARACLRFVVLTACRSGEARGATLGRGRPRRPGVVHSGGQDEGRRATSGPACRMRR